MDFQKEEGRIYLEKDGKIIAEIEYEDLGNNEYNIFHTFVDESLRGQGVASKLVELAIEEIKKKNEKKLNSDSDVKIRATCSYAKVWLERHKLA